MKIKICTKCKIEKNINEFNKCSRNRDGRDYVCADCKAEGKREYYTENVERERKKRRDYGIKHKIERAEYGKQYKEKNRKRIRLDCRNYYYLKTHGISLKQKEQMIVDQDYKCLSCGTDLRLVAHDKTCVDHDHKSGKIRGILCHHCNVCLGLLGEDVNRVYKLAEYIIKYCNK